MKIQLYTGLVILFVQFAICLQAQTLELARIDLNTLSSPLMSGRGYQENGHRKAAEYISKRFKEIGLEPYISVSDSQFSYFQNFSFNLNVCDSVSIFTGNEKLFPGKDFIVHPLSGSVSDELDFKDLEYGMGEDWEGSRVKNKAVLLRLGYPDYYRQDEKTKEMFKHQTGLDFKLEMSNIHSPALVFIRKEKLTASLSGSRLPYGIVEILPGRLNRKTRNIQAHISTNIRKIETANVIGWIKGKKYPDSLVIISAHYDHLGRQSEAVFTGANDNASGIAFILALANQLSQPGTQADYSVVFIAFGAEEAGLKGSNFFVQNLDSADLKRIRYMLNFDLMGNGDEGISLVAGAEFPELATEIKNKLAQKAPELTVEIRKNAANSDHYPFVKAGIPGIFTYTKGGPPHYHDVYDTSETVRFPVWNEILQTYLNVILSY